MKHLLPPRFVAAAVACMALLAYVWPAVRPIPMPWALIGVAPLLGGAAITVTSATRFSRVGTNIVTTEDPDLLVADGWFARSRNPMYLGFLLVLGGSAVVMGGGVAFVGPVAFFAAAHYWYIPHEERRLEATLGDRYREYRSTIRRWL